MDAAAAGRTGSGAGIGPAILYEDDWLIAVDKPAGLIVHGDGTGAPTLTDAVRALLAARDGAEAAAGLQAVQRLDRDTTGIVLFSKVKDVQPALDRMVADRSLEKNYLAIACGRIPWGERRLTGAIGRDRHDARRMRVSPTGKPARTDARVLARRAGQGRVPACSLVEVRLHTGRRHQIRVHLASEGFPLLGDELYGSGRAATAFPLMLHAWRLAFEHPVTGERVVIEAPVPERFERLFPNWQKSLGNS